MPKRLPRPWVTPSINLGEPTREWKTIPNARIGVGDIIPDYGKVTDAKSLGHNRIALAFLNGTVVHVESDAESFVFTNG